MSEEQEEAPTAEPSATATSPGGGSRSGRAVPVVPVAGVSGSGIAAGSAALFAAAGPIGLVAGGAAVAGGGALLARRRWRNRAGSAGRMTRTKTMRTTTSRSGGAARKGGAGMAGGGGLAGRARRSAGLAAGAVAGRRRGAASGAGAGAGRAGGRSGAGALGRRGGAAAGRGGAGLRGGGARPGAGRTGGGSGRGGLFGRAAGRGGGAGGGRFGGGSGTGRRGGGTASGRRHGGLPPRSTTGGGSGLFGRGGGSGRPGRGRGGSRPTGGGGGWFAGPDTGTRSRAARQARRALGPGTAPSRGPRERVSAQARRMRARMRQTRGGRFALGIGRAGWLLGAGIGALGAAAAAASVAAWPHARAYARRAGAYLSSAWSALLLRGRRGEEDDGLRTGFQPGPGNRRPGGLVAVRRGGIRMSASQHRVMLAAHELANALAAYNEEGMLAYVEGLDAVPDALNVVAGGIGALAVSALQEQPLDPSVANFISGISVGQGNIALAAQQLRPLVEEIHAEDLRRLREQRAPNDFKWDQSHNRR